MDSFRSLQFLAYALKPETPGSHSGIRLTRGFPRHVVMDSQRLFIAQRKSLPNGQR